MNYGDGEPSLTMSDAASNSVVLNLGDGIELTTEAKTFYVVVPATATTFYVTIEDVNGWTMTKSTNAVINRNKILPMRELSYAPAVFNLSASGTANCYIVPGAGDYCFDATVIGNGTSGLLGLPQTQTRFHTTDVTIDPQSAQLIWQDVNGLVTVSTPSIVNGKVNFTASSARGNALIAVYASNDCSGDIIWSWHIWCTEQPGNQVYKKGSKYFTLLDRNLGATTATKGSDDEEKLASYGLLYQWGRKDPFIGPNGITSTHAKSLYDKNGNIYSMPSPAEVDKGVPSISYAIAHPTLFLTGLWITGYDWYYGSADKTSVNNHYLWGNPYGYNYNTVRPYTESGTSPIYPSKTIYDPCPPGYKVAERDTWTNFNNGGINAEGSFSNGYDFHMQGTDAAKGTTWYPAAGYLTFAAGLPLSAGNIGRYWNSSPYSNGSPNGGCLEFNSTQVLPLASYCRANGKSVRCSN
ncbi:MAG: hypothetical protein PHD11_06820 [Bacteroidales bacterium]|nr:hypothetical protein [Bacteroidales bacterium]MDD4671061.1 hypothetical protein [Bacteroidales bacterium]